MRFLTLITAALVSVFVASSVPAQDNTNAQNSPLIVLQTMSNDLIAGLKANKATLKSDPTIIPRLVDTVILPHVNKEAMIKIVLGRKGYQEWKTADDAAKQTFEKEFTNLIINTYTAALQSFNNEEVKIAPLRKPLGDEKRVRLYASIINKEGPPVAMAYVFERDQETWKIIDFSVEGISLIQSYQSQFQEILSQGNGFQHLVDVLSQHNIK